MFEFVGMGGELGEVARSICATCLFEEDAAAVFLTM